MFTNRKTLNRWIDATIVGGIITLTAYTAVMTGWAAKALAQEPTPRIMCVDWLTELRAQNSAAAAEWRDAKAARCEEKVVKASSERKSSTRTVRPLPPNPFRLLRWGQGETPDDATRQKFWREYVAYPWPPIKLELRKED